MPNLNILEKSPTTDFAPLPSSLRGISADAVYLHVPFCSTKCHYCDFYSLAGHLDESADFLAALEIELRLQTQTFGTPRPRTIFIGGGTPTLLAPNHLRQLLSLIHQYIDLAALEEFTLEANPNTFDAEKAAILFSHKVNRISFGAQSFHLDELATLQRDHDPASVPRAFDFARNAGFANLSLDLIFGIPGQTLASWESSLAQALALHPTHMSCYSLIYEPNTAMTARLRRGEFQPLDEELELEMFLHVYSRLRAAGFTRYEISNYALSDPASENSPGKNQCRHNLAYWKARNWLALGPSAGAHLAHPNLQENAAAPVAHQWKNTASLTHYLTALHPSHPKLPITQLESLIRKNWSAAAAVFWLRLSEGLNYAEFRQHTGINPQPQLERSLKKYADLHLVELTPTFARILDPGVQVSNRILADALHSLESPHP